MLGWNILVDGGDGYGSGWVGGCRSIDGGHGCSMRVNLVLWLVMLGVRLYNVDLGVCMSEVGNCVYMGTLG